MLPAEALPCALFSNTALRRNAVIRYNRFSTRTSTLLCVAPISAMWKAVSVLRDVAASAQHLVGLGEHRSSALQSSSFARLAGEPDGDELEGGPTSMVSPICSGVGCRPCRPADERFEARSRSRRGAGRCRSSAVPRARAASSRSPSPRAGVAPDTAALGQRALRRQPVAGLEPRSCRYPRIERTMWFDVWSPSPGRVARRRIGGRSDGGQTIVHEGLLVSAAAERASLTRRSIGIVSTKTW